MSPSADYRIPALAALSAVAYGLVSWWSHKKRNPGGLPLPPGPKPLPVVGNVLGLKIDEPWVTYTHWGATYGKGLTVYTKSFLTIYFKVIWCTLVCLTRKSF